MPSAITKGRSPCLMPISDINARMPPSPSLSARITIATYFTEVVMISVQTAQCSGRCRFTACPLDRGFEGVERARADVAIDDPQRTDRHGSERTVLWAGLRGRLRVGGCLRAFDGGHSPLRWLARFRIAGPISAAVCGGGSV